MMYVHKYTPEHIMIAVNSRWRFPAFCFLIHSFLPSVSNVPTVIHRLRGRFQCNNVNYEDRAAGRRAEVVIPSKS